MGSDFSFEFWNRSSTLRPTVHEGGLDWSRDHNSRFEITKLAVLHASRKTIRDPEDDSRRIQLDRPELRVNGHIIGEVSSYKYLGILIDAQLRWNEQAHRAVANATKWLLQYRRLTKLSTGTCAKLMRRLYVSVALPKITYGLDVWYTPPNKKAGQTKNSGSSAALQQLQKAQRMRGTYHFYDKTWAVACTAAF